MHNSSAHTFEMGSRMEHSSLRLRQNSQLSWISVATAALFTTFGIAATVRRAASLRMTLSRHCRESKTAEMLCVKNRCMSRCKKKSKNSSAL